MNGDVLGYFKDAKIKQGYTSSTAIEQSSVTYTSHTASTGNGGGTIYLVASSTQYQNADGSGQETTNNTYTWFSNASGMTNRLAAMQVQLPIVPMNQNGPGTPATAATIRTIRRR